MLKVCELVHRRPGMSVEEFQDYWRHTHGPIVARIPGIRGYVQSHPQMGGYARGPLAYDGVAEIWMDDKAALRNMAETPEFAVAKQDEANFIDISRLVELVVDEHIIVDKPVDGVKLISFLQFKSDMAPAEAQAHWRSAHAEIVCKIPTLGRYTQSHLRLGAYRRTPPPVCDGLAITWFDSVDAMRASAKTPAYAAVRADEPNFLAGPPPPFIITRENVVI